jgi:hypothetical protein
MIQTKHGPAREVLSYIKANERRIANGNDHSYWLRPDLPITFRLPLDLSPREAERLGTFVQALVYA